MQNNENYELCSKCGGRCCKNFGCYISPDEVIKRKGEISFDIILELLKSGYVAMDWWEGDILEDDESIPNCELYCQVFYLRMRHKSEGAICGSWGGECVCLTDTGCMFTWNNRPLGGRSLIPTADKACEDTSYTKEQCVLEWREYYDILSEVYDKYWFDMKYN